MNEERKSVIFDDSLVILDSLNQVSLVDLYFNLPQPRVLENLYTAKLCSEAQKIY